MGLHGALTDQLRAHVETDVLRSTELLVPRDSPARHQFDALRAQLRIDVEMWAAQIAGPDAELAARTLRTVLLAFFGDMDDFDPEPSWWRSPLGRCTLVLVGHPSKERVSIRMASDMLGMSRQGAHDLARRGRLERTEQGQITVASIVGYLDLDTSGSPDRDARRRAWSVRPHG